MSGLVWPACVAAGTHALCCACSNLEDNKVGIQGAAALASALCVLTGLTKLQLRGNHISWARLKRVESEEAMPDVDLNSARLLHPLLKSMVARGGVVELEAARVRDPQHGAAAQRLVLAAMCCGPACEGTGDRRL